jgi:hypothetical protein
VISVTTVIFALIGSAIGGLLGSWLQIRHQRREAFRERMLEAADNAANAIGAALTATRVALSEVENRMMNLTTSEATARSAQLAGDALDQGQHFAGRVDLLFGLNSGIGDALRTARGSLRRALAEAGRSSPEIERAVKTFSEAEVAYEQFVEGAREAATSYGTWRSWKVTRMLVARRES